MHCAGESGGDGRKGVAGFGMKEFRRDFGAGAGDVFS